MEAVAMRRGQEAQLETLIRQLHALRAEMLELEATGQPVLGEVDEAHRSSAANLLHYLALRRHDIREMQAQLAGLGLSSLGRTEPHVIAALHAVLKALNHLSGSEDGEMPAEGSGERVGDGQNLLKRNTEALLGPAPTGRTVRIMVTVPREAATNFDLVRDLVGSGMDCMRINCAHDEPAAWEGMISNLRRAERETGKKCKVAMDVPGPKLRTGPVEPGPAVLKYRPQRDALGRVVKPARVWLTPDAAPEPPPSSADASVPVSGEWLATVEAGDRIRFTDARGARRLLRVTSAEGKSRWAEARRTSYLVPGLELERKAAGKEADHAKGRIGGIAATEQVLRLKQGDSLILTRSLEGGHPARMNEKNEVVAPAEIGVTLPEFFECVQCGEPIWFDDGKIGGVVREVGPERVAVEITQARATGEKLGAEKGINVPETKLKLGALTAEDLKFLDFIVGHADIIGYSFVRSDADVRALQRHLAELGGENLGIILKIETRQGFEKLPELLLAAMRSRAVGVMIARGDLAVECGFQRLAEVQEEILWISEAAHVPVIWATQVLESLAKTGIPSRSEITDAAMGERAECVMLNKGPYVVAAVRILDDILRRMQAHQEKKRSMLRELHLASTFHAGGA
jgi:pyruvate kinase